jgi:hypothetical protein
MKLTSDRPFADPDKAARKLVEIANMVEAVQDGRIHIELINAPFLQGGGSPVEYKAGLERAIAKGWADNPSIEGLCEVQASWRGIVCMMPAATLLQLTPRSRNQLTDG